MGFWINRALDCVFVIAIGVWLFLAVQALNEDISSWLGRAANWSCMFILMVNVIALRLRRAAVMAGRIK